MAIDRENDEYHLLGLALVAAQRVEFALYGIAAHAAHMPAAQKEKRFRELTPERFLRGDASELKATLGQLIETFGDTFLIRTPELVSFYKDRKYVRTFRMDIRGAPDRQEAREFLLGFLERALSWENVLRGFLAELMRAAAEKEGREAELACTAEDLARIKVYREHVAKHLVAN